MRHALGVILEAGPTVRKNGVPASTRTTLAAREVTYANARLPRVIEVLPLIAATRLLQQGDIYSLLFEVAS